MASTLSSGMRKMNRILSGTFTAAGWTTTTLNSVTVYTQTATVTGCTSTTQLSDPKFQGTNSLTTNATLQETLNLINLGYTVANSGTITSYVSEAPTTDITVYWSGKQKHKINFNATVFERGDVNGYGETTLLISIYVDGKRISINPDKYISSNVSWRNRSDSYGLSTNIEI